MMQRQGTRRDEDLVRRLRAGLAREDAVGVGRLLAPLPLPEALALLAEALTRPTPVAFWLRVVGRALFWTLVVALIFDYFQHWLVLNDLFKRGHWWLAVCVMNLPTLLGTLLARDKRKRQCQRTTAATLLETYLKSADRHALGPLLELAPLLLPKERIAARYRDLLAYLLSRTPARELEALTSAQRTGLCWVTRRALDEAPYNAYFEALASAGLLTLGTLRDDALRRPAEAMVLRYPKQTFGVAAEEYLSQIAN